MEVNKRVSSTAFERYFVVLLPLVAVGLAILLQYSDLDLRFAGQFYDSENGVWPYKDYWLTQNVLHLFAQHFVEFLGLLLLITVILLSFSKPHRHLRNVLACCILSMASASIIVGFLKAHMHIYCPWDLTLLGGIRPYVLLFETRVPGLPVGNAFPSAHAAVGFMFVSFYFSSALLVPRWRFLVLGFALGLGLTFGLVQQMRGAHFLSHDLISLSICWLSALVVHFIFYGSQMREFFFSRTQNVDLASVLKPRQLTDV
jgi:membrane-associated PAP2 superfamily phosphatase